MYDSAHDIAYIILEVELACRVRYFLIMIRETMCHLYVQVFKRWIYLVLLVSFIVRMHIPRSIPIGCSWSHEERKDPSV